MTTLRRTSLKKFYLFFSLLNVLNIVLYNIQYSKSLLFTSYLKDNTNWCLHVYTKHVASCLCTADNFGKKSCILTTIHLNSWLSFCNQNTLKYFKYHKNPFKSLILSSNPFNASSRLYK